MILRKKKIYRISSRVKTGESIYEKFIRRNLISSLDNIDIENENGVLSKYICSIDDIIGLRITVKLTESSIIIQNVLEENKVEFMKKGIVLCFDNCIDEMKNGLSIIKMKCMLEKSKTFGAPLNFELQIKGEFDAVWGDIEHSLFYKDYSIYPEKDNNHSIMNSLGKTLNNIDGIIGVINNTRKGADQEYLLKVFQHQVDVSFSEEITGKIGATFNVQPICSILFSLLNIGFDDIYNIATRSKKYIFDERFFTGCHSKEIDNFIKFQENDFSLMILEYIYFCLKQDNYSHSPLNRLNFFSSLLHQIYFSLEPTPIVNEIYKRIIEIFTNQEFEIVESDKLLDRDFTRLLLEVLKIISTEINSQLEIYKESSAAEIETPESIESSLSKRLYTRIIDLFYCNSCVSAEDYEKLFEESDYTFISLISQVLNDEKLCESPKVNKKMIIKLKQVKSKLGERK